MKVLEEVKDAWKQVREKKVGYYTALTRDPAAVAEAFRTAAKSKG